FSSTSDAARAGFAEHSTLAASSNHPTSAPRATRAECKHARLRHGCGLGSASLCKRRFLRVAWSARVASRVSARTLAKANPGQILDLLKSRRGVLSPSPYTPTPCALQ